MVADASITPGDFIQLLEVAEQLTIEDPTFKVLSLHQGGMGICYKLQSVENQKCYSLKCILPSLIGTNEEDRFTDEINVWLTASACDAIAEAITVIRYNDMPAILSPWYENGDLASHIKKLTPTQKFEVLVRTVRALSWAYHKLGVIHRDIKPGNILLDESLLSYLSDWGLARPVSYYVKAARTENYNTDIQRPNRTQPGEIMGTVFYISPEQILHPEEVDHRSDIYSLGCLMYELETGYPPFLGSSVQEVLEKQVNSPPPKIGGYITSKLGLDDVISICLSKSPSSRFTTYEELERELIIIAKKCAFSLERCQITERYKRYPLGKGEVFLRDLIHESNVTSKDGLFSVLDLKDIQPILEESEFLMTLGRYSEAVNLLKPLAIPVFLLISKRWHAGHYILLNYAFCLLNIPDRTIESIEIFTQLEELPNKPANFYIDFSLALLISKDYPGASRICIDGLKVFPNDPDLLGNYTIALMNLGLLEEAYLNAKKRIRIRKDTHSIGEMTAVLGEMILSTRDVDLPKALELAKEQYQFIAEGLELNQTAYTLLLTKIKLFRFINCHEKAWALSQHLFENENVPIVYKQSAFIQLVGILSESDSSYTALEWIDKTIDSIESEDIKQELVNIRMQILADKYMIGHLNNDGERLYISQVIEYFLTKPNGNYQDLIMTARVLDWIGNSHEAKNILIELSTKQSTNSKARQELVLLLSRSGQINEALVEANRLVDMFPLKAESFHTLSKILQQRGDLTSSYLATSKGNELKKQELLHLENFKDLLGL